MPLGHFSVPVRTKFGNEPESMKFRADSDFTRHGECKPPKKGVRSPLVFDAIFARRPIKERLPDPLQMESISLPTRYSEKPVKKRIGGELVLRHYPLRCLAPIA